MAVLLLNRRSSFDELVDQCELARSSAQDAIDRSVDLLDRLTATQRRVTTRRLSRDGTTRYAWVEGVVDGAPVAGVVHRDGTVSGEPPLLRGWPSW